MQAASAPWDAVHAELSLWRLDSMHHFLRGSLVVAISVLLAAPAFAGTVYEWVTDDGVRSYADVLKRVPKRYQAQAKRRTVGSLASYERWTPSDARASGSYAARLDGNLERLRAMNAALDPADAAGTRSPVRMRLRTGRNGDGLDIPVAGDGPVVVEKLHTKLPGDDATRSVTLIRQGDEVVAMVVAQDNVRDIEQIDADELMQGLSERPVR
jgi:hypothetical protein